MDSRSERYIRSSHLLLGVSAALLLCAAPVLRAAPAPVGRVQYNRDIRPILSENCFACHGNDHTKRMAELRLDVREVAMARGAIVPGKPLQSKLVQRVYAASDSMRMPPTYSHKKLTEAQKALLKRWITEGAVYQKHWSLTPPPAIVPVPTVHSLAWCRTPIDRFVMARLEKERLAPSHEASRTDWLRRVTLDLVGLPPTREEIRAFLADRSAQAHAHVVDRLLASPHYGEKMALPWLDIARYADSYGYQSDQLCPTWPYRDWVVKAFNDNLPYDKFITWQIAGDLLPNPTREQRLATAFNRLHRMTNEGGSVPEEWRIEGVADRVKTFGTAFLGLTTECARCHDHKYDPIAQRDYYALSAYFNSIDEYGLYDRADIVPSPSLLLPTPDQERTYSAARKAAEQAEAALTALRQSREPAFRAWLDSHPSTPAVLPDLTGRFYFARFDGTTLKNLAAGATKNGVRSDEVPLVNCPAGKAALLDGENNVNFPDLGRFGRHSAFTIAFRMRDLRLVDAPMVVFQACDGTDAGPHGYDLMIDRGVLTARLFRHWPGNAIAVRAKQVVPKDTWAHVTVSYDGSSRAAGLRIYLDGRAVPLQIVRDKMVKGIGEHTLVFGQRFRDRGFKGGQIADLSIFAREVSPIEVAQIFDDHSLSDALRSPAQHEAELRDFYLSAIDQDARKAATQLASAREQVWRAEDPQVEVAVMEETAAPRPTYVLARGRYDAPRTADVRVGRDVPSAVLPMPKSLPRNRLGLAGWLIRPDNPLTARVEVNRLWSLFFGRGLVETAEDFGVQGKPPTHPDLLDWLARDFIRSGWNVKAMMRQIALSSVYRQVSALRPDLRERDPQNLLLARGPSQRLSAEIVRDVALAASGLLDGRIGGPPVSPYQPGDLWRESNTMSPAYHQSVGTDLYRRSLYTVWKRTAPMPDMIAFDAAGRETCIARRQTTNTPLQALVLLNDTQFVEAARVLAERAMKQGGPSGDRCIRYSFERLAAREPTAQEEQILQQLYSEQQSVFRAQPADAAKLVRIGDSKPDTNLPAVDLAALTVVEQTILNLDATVWKR